MQERPQDLSMFLVSVLRKALAFPAQCVVLRTGPELRLSKGCSQTEGA